MDEADQARSQPTRLVGALCQNPTNIARWQTNASGRRDAARPARAGWAALRQFRFRGISGSERRWSSGDRSERATGSTPPTPLIESRVDWTQLTGLVALTRARGGHANSAPSVSRPTRAIWLSRLGGAAALGDVVISFSRNPFAAIGANDDDDAARRASSGRFSQLRGHRQQIEKSPALTPAASLLVETFTVATASKRVQSKLSPTYWLTYIQVALSSSICTEAPMRPKQQMLFSTLFVNSGYRDTHSSKYQTCSNCLDRDGEPCCEARLGRRGLLQREREPEPLALNG